MDNVATAKSGNEPGATCLSTRSLLRPDVALLFMLDAYMFAKLLCAGYVQTDVHTECDNTQHSRDAGLSLSSTVQQQNITLDTQDDKHIKHHKSLDNAEGHRNK